MEVGDQHYAPAALPPARTGKPLYIKLFRLQGLSGWLRKISPHRGSNPEPSSS